MYDSAVRAKLVYTALKEAFASKAEEQKQAVGAANSLLLADTDLAEITERLQTIGVHLHGSLQRDNHSMEMQADFRGVQVTVVLPAQLACNDAVGNPIYWEMQALSLIHI